MPRRETNEEPAMAVRALRSWRRLALPTRCLLSARFWRSISQGALVVDLALYLHALGWSGAGIGLVLSAAGFAGAGLNLAVGITSDRLSRKPFLLTYEMLTCLCALVAMTWSSPWLLGPAIVLAGFGRGANGAAGPFAPAEQAWLADAVAAASRGFVYSLNSALGFTGMALGALAASLPAFWVKALGPAGSYRPLFLLVLLGNAVNLYLLARAPEADHRSRRPRAEKRAGASREGGRRTEKRFLTSLVGLNSLNGLAIGLTGPLITYWFAMRFHIGPAFIGPVMAATFAVTAAASLTAGHMTRRVGLVRSVVWGRSGGLVLLLLFPVMPFYLLAALVYLLRSALNRGTIGARQALVVSAVRDERRGLASSLNALSVQVPMSVGPTFAGAMIGAGWFVTPFYVAAALQGLYVLLYGRVFAPYERALLDDESLKG